ncbi:P-loop NTPase fold protein [Tenacibaculum sp. 190524A05c]|uniref:P-loop NTPase fold protein n=1 Tax=Tenacibaculum platacis TaxID=3137852 RepID=UPI0032B10C7B
MSESFKKPNYIASSPSGEDLFEGKSHEKTSNTIFELIKDKSLPNNVVGIEGKWGSGKSNVVSILNKRFDEIKSDYFFFTYDAWGHQEDLTRRTFLDELISSLKTEKKFKGNIDWTQELNKLLAKKSITNTTKFPKIKFYWILVMASILLFSFLNILYADFLVKIDIIPNYNLPYLKLFLSKYFLPMLLFGRGLKELKKEYKAFDNKKETQDFDYKERLKRLLYIFSGSDLESEELEHTLENEPTVKSFKEYFENITSDLKSDGLIIVFDNMDRLSKSDKVLSLWSSIHTFFAEEKIDNVWVIIPYDKEHLAKHFDEKNDNKVDNFIGKTFSTIFRISPPVLSDWKKFFTLKFKEAFKDIINDDDIDFISSLYEIITDTNNRGPRDIITFVNNLTSLYLQHNNSIDIKYLALFSLREKEILSNPLTTISSKQFLKQESYLFSDNAELEESLAAIVYNVNKEKSSEILLKNNIEDIFFKANLDVLKEVKKHSEFKTYFDNVIQKGDFPSSRPENTAKILEEIKDVVSSKSLSSYWEKFGKNLDRRPEEEFQLLTDWHKNILAKTSKETSKKLADKIVYNSKQKFKKSEKGSDYYLTVFDLIEYINENSISINIELDKVEFTSDQFVYFIDDMENLFKEGKCTFKDLKIYSNSKELNKYYIENKDGIPMNHKWLHVIKFLIENDKSYNFEEFRKHIETKLQAVSYTSEDDIKYLIEIIKTLTGKKPLKLIPEATATNYLNHNGSSDRSPYFDIIANQIAHLETSVSRSSYFTTELDKIDNAEQIAQVIHYYIDYGSLLKLVIDEGKNHLLLNKVINLVTLNQFGFTQSLNIKWIFENLDKIKTKIFKNNFNDFLNRFDSWSKYFEENFKEKDVFYLRTSIIELTFSKDNHSFNSIKHLHNKIISELNKTSKEVWLENFGTDNNLNFAFKGLIENELLDKKITKNTVFMSAYDQYFESIAKIEKSIPDDVDFWNNLLENDYLDGRKLNRIFNDILDIIINQTEVSSNHIKFFALGLFKYSSNIVSKADEVCRKIILHFKDDDDLFIFIIQSHLEKLIEILNSSKGLYNQDLSEMFNLAGEQELIEPKIINSIFEQTKLVIPVKKADNEKGKEE